MATENDPCPCGSPWTYGECCFTFHQVFARVPVDTYCFFPSGYSCAGGVNPAIICERQIRPQDWALHAFLVNFDKAYSDESRAGLAKLHHASEAVLDRAFAETNRSGTDVESILAFLGTAGYCALEDDDLDYDRNLRRTKWMTRRKI